LERKFTRRNFYIAILKERIKAGYLYEPEPKFLEKLDPKMTEEEINNLPDGLIKDTAINQLNSYRRYKEDYDEELQIWKDANHAIETNDGESAFLILNQTADYDYQFKPIDGYRL